MIYFCADDYGISKECNTRIRNCVSDGILNKISILPNGENTDFKQYLSGSDVKLSLHINLVEGYPLCEPCDIDMIVSEKGYFKYSFIGLFFASIFGKKRQLEKQLYKEIQKQIEFWKNNMGENATVSIDSHQHTHMIPLVFKVLMQVIKDENLKVECIRIPSEPITPYLFNPSLYFSYSISGIVKQWLLKFLAAINHKELKKTNLNYSYFMGAMFSGKLTQEKIEKLLPRYLKIANKHNKDIEIAFHPGYLEDGERLIVGHRKSFEKFYFSPWRKEEYNTLINFKSQVKTTKEGNKNAVH